MKSHNIRLVCHMTTFILTLAGTVTSSNGYSVNSRSAQKHLSDQLLSLWMNGDSLSSDSLTSNSNSKGVDQNNDESMRKVLEFLTNKASEKDSNRKIPSAAIQGLNALVSGAAKTPQPINLTVDKPMKAVMKYLTELGITNMDCQMKTICELMMEPQASYGVFGELLNFVFGQETPNENAIGPFDNHTFKDLYAAAQNGRRMNDCPSLYSKCSTSYKEFIKLVNI